MKILSIQEAYQRKFSRQNSIEKLEYHAAGHCVHIGKLSPGCHRCFVPDTFSFNLHVGSQCNLSCPYCPGVHGEEYTTPEEILLAKGVLLQRALKTDFERIFPTVSFSGGGEPLMHIDVLTNMMAFCHDIENYMGKKPWYYLYTNGILADYDTILQLKDMGFDEVRFHLGASNFAGKVYEHMANAARLFDTVTVETPAWPPHRKALFEMLPRIEDIGVRHLNIGEVWLNEHNRESIALAMPEGEIYHCFYVHLYDDGLTYDIIEEVLRRNYSFSVLDCNCFVKSIQRSQAKWVIHETVEGLCQEHSQQSNL